MKGPGRAQLFHEPNCKLTDFSRLILGPGLKLRSSFLTSSTTALCSLQACWHCRHMRCTRPSQECQVTWSYLGPGSHSTRTETALKQGHKTWVRAENLDKSIKTKWRTSILPVHLHYSTGRHIKKANPCAKVGTKTIQKASRKPWSILSKTLDWYKLISAALPSIFSMIVRTKWRLSWRVLPLTAQHFRGRLDWQGGLQDVCQDLRQIL